MDPQTTNYLIAQLDECSFALPWSVIDTRNTTARPDASRPYVDFEIIAGGNPQFTTGSPGANLHQETGQITIAWKVPIRDEANQALAGQYAYALLKRFLYLGTRFDCDDRQVRLSEPLRMGDGQNEAGLWIETMAVSYKLFHVG